MKSAAYNCGFDTGLQDAQYGNQDVGPFKRWDQMFKHKKIPPSVPEPYIKGYNDGVETFERKIKEY